jgi:hypothetical protein
MKKVALLALLLLTIAPLAQAVCNIDIIDEGIPPFTVGVPGSFTLTGCCGTPPYTFTITSGTLPPGLTMNSSGTISGTATAPRDNNIVCIKITDSATPKCHVTKCFYISAE